MPGRSGPAHRVLPGGGSISASIADDTITFSVVENFNGTETFIATVTDGEYTDQISEVRGRGLFLGIDLINHDNNLPNEKLATKLINHMRDNSILLSTDGPHHNVIKIKPPLPFNIDDCDFLTYELNQFFKNN